MYIVTGAAGFIGSVVAAAMAHEGLQPLVLVDDWNSASKQPNWISIPSAERVDRTNFLGWARENRTSIQAIVHLGARTDTTEPHEAIFDHLNLGYTLRIWRFCSENHIPLIYASSAATYGAGELGFQDDHDLVARLQPLNPYGRSKNDTDFWLLSQREQPPFWAGLKFFNVYGPNEYHKGRMASVIFHAFHQIQNTGALKLFRSHRPDYRDGEQLRDFVYVKDVAKVILFLLRNRPASGIYNLGTGEARTFLDLGKAVFAGLGLQPNIDFVDTPADIRDTYQYFTEASMGKLRSAGYPDAFASLEAGVSDYVQQYLVPGKHFR